MKRRKQCGRIWRRITEKMDRCKRIKAAIVLEAAVLVALAIIFYGDGIFSESGTVEVNADGYIKWVDFNVSYEALCRAYEYDVSTYDAKIHLDWIDLLAYVAAKTGGDFGPGATEEIHGIAEKILAGETTMETAANGSEIFFRTTGKLTGRCWAVLWGSTRCRKKRAALM